MLSPVGQVARTGEADEPVVIIHKRTPGSGHLEAAMCLADAVRFADSELAQGRLVFLEMGEESWMIRKGREIAEWVKKLFKPGAGEQPKVTTFAPMAGGEIDVAEVPEMPPLPTRRDYGRDVQMEGQGPRPYPTANPPRVAPPAEIRAWEALCARIGTHAALAMVAGGGYAVRSKLWRHVLYVVTPEIIKVVNQGVQVSAICIIPTDGVSVWDAVLNRISLLEAGEEGEVQVFGTGQLQGPRL